MKIGIEAKWLHRGPPSGKRVVYNLVKSLSGLANDHELHFFLDARSRDEPLPIDTPESRRHYLWAGNNQLANVLLVPREADRLGLDVVVYQNFVPPPAVARHARVAFVHDVIFDSHPQFFTPRERLYFKPLRYLTSSADRVCTVSRSESLRMAHYRYAPLERIDVVPHGVDSSFLPRECLPSVLLDRVRAELGISGEFVLYVGRLTARKNVASLVRAMARVRSRGVELVIVGAADRTCEDLAALATSLGIRGSIRFLGAMDIADERLRALYALASVFCFPSLEESFGLPPLEAMASGTPAIVSDVAAITETCGDAAMRVDATDPAAIANAIDELLADPCKRDALRNAGFARARSFTWKNSAERLLATIETAVRGAA